MKHESKSGKGFRLTFVEIAIIPVLILIVGYVMNIVAIFQAGSLTGWGWF
jgi:hypothetical protein